MRALIKVSNDSYVHFTSKCDIDFFITMTTNYIKTCGNCKPQIISKTNTNAKFNRKLEEVMQILKKAYIPLQIPLFEF